MEEKLKEARDMLLKLSANGSISCTEARRIAEELGLPKKSLGDLANELKIKIRACELGCF